jgi:hypothetical protein
MSRLSDWTDGGDFEDADLTAVVETAGVGPVRKTISKMRKFVGVAPGRDFSADTSLTLDDIGAVLIHPSADTTARVVTVPANASVAFPVRTVITITNLNGAGVVTIAITSDTMRLSGPGTTGSRTLADNGVATLIKVAATEWIIFGSELT